MTRMMALFRQGARIVETALLMAAMLLCAAVPGSAKTINREILGLYDSSAEIRYEETRLHRLLEMPLNHLGYKVTPHDIAKGLPDPSEIKRYYAVATWFTGRISNAEAYLKWAAKAARGGTRFVVLDSAGATGDEKELPLINEFLKELGIAYANYYVGETAATEIKVIDEAIIGFEHKLDPKKLPGHQVVVLKLPSTKVHLSLADPAYKWAGTTSSVLVTTNPKGGFASGGFTAHYDETTQRFRWVINPFTFLETALGQGLRPIPDTTTVSGRRLYFSHIDGDGWNNITDVQPYAAEDSTAAEVVLDALIAPYPDLPVSVGLIGGDADRAYGGTEKAAGIARAIFALPQVEVASHTHTHPYNWEFFANYSRDREVNDILEFTSKDPDYDVNLMEVASDLHIAKMQKSMAAEDAAGPASTEPGTQKANDVILPRAHPHADFDAKLEVLGALNIATELAPPEKPAKIYLWSGNTRPFEEAIRLTRESGAKNLNGGDSRFDSIYPSAAYVAPLSRIVGKERQIYAVNSNENTYTDGWTGPYDAFKLLTETLDNTESPRRLKGFNLYYHSFSASKQLGLDTIVAHLERARVSKIAPITASHYASIAEGFFSAELSAAGRDRWRIAKRGGLNTVRFDRPGNFSVDYAASKGVTGHNVHAGSLYVALDPAVTDVLVALKPATMDGGNRKPMARLIDSRWIVSGLKQSGCRLEADVQGFGKGEMTWEGMRPGSYEIVVESNGEQVTALQATADSSGRLTATLDANAIEPLKLKMGCFG